jgi:antirestriction protein ArdC
MVAMLAYPLAACSAVSMAEPMGMRSAGLSASHSAERLAENLVLQSAASMVVAKVGLTAAMMGKPLAGQTVDHLDAWRVDSKEQHWAVQKAATTDEVMADHWVYS